MSSPIQIESVSTDQVSYVEIAGSIDAGLALGPILDAVTQKRVVLNLAKIDEITQDGRERWQELLAAVDEQVEQLVFVECAPVVVQELNRNAHFFGHHEMASTCVPLECEVCLRKTIVAIAMDQPVTEDTLMFSCAQCDSPLVPAIEPAKYFAFLNDMAVTSLSADMQEAMTAFANRHSCASIEPGSEAAEEMRAIAEAIASAESTAPKALNAVLADATDLQPCEVTHHQARPDDATAIPPTLSPPCAAVAAKAPVCVNDPTPPAFPAITHGGQKRRTDPALPMPKGARATNVNKTSPGIATPATQGRLRILLGALLDNTVTTVACAIAVAAILLLVIVTTLGRPSGVPPELVLSFVELLRNEQFAQAEKFLTEHSETTSPELLEMARAGIADGRKNQAKRSQEEAKKAYAKSNFEDALRYAKTVLATEARDIEALFIAGESLRQIDKLIDAGGYYESFIAQAEKDPRLDDARFWMAESLVAQNNLPEASKLFASISTTDSSRFKTSAQRRLAEIDAELSLTAE